MLKIFPFCLSALLLVASCKDKKSVFVPEQNAFKVVPTYFKQNVLVENIVSESLGESVENSFFVSALNQKYKEQLIIANLHKQDWLETPYTNDLTTMLGGLVNYPRATINRMEAVNLIPNETNSTLLRPIHWEYNIENALQGEAKVSLAIETSFQTEGYGSIKLHMAHKEALANDMRIGIYMLEDSIQSIFQVGSTQNFTHQNVMKNSLFDITGDTVDLSFEFADGVIQTKEYHDIDLKIYHLQHLYLVAFLYNFDADYRKMKVYNAIKVKFGGVKFWNE